MSRFDVLVPVKALGDAKQRLQDRLSGPARADLMYAMVEKVLAAAVSASQVRAAFVVTPDGRVGELARRLGAHVLPDEGRGLNPALSDAIALRRQAGAQAIALVQGDLPGLTASALDEFLASVRSPVGGAIVPDQTGMGTSALAWRGATPPRLAFGAGSFARHMELAREDGLELVVHASRPPFFDVDDFADLVAVVALDGAPL
jgi:2-phospho-L-lactate guanylyltransferase